MSRKESHRAPESNTEVPCSDADILVEHRFDGVQVVGGLAYDGHALWFADGTNRRLVRIDPRSGHVLKALGDIEIGTGTAFDGRCLWQVGTTCIQRIDPETGEVTSKLPLPAEGFISGMAWAEGALWVGHMESKSIFKIDPANGRVLKRVETARFVTGIAWLGHELWHGAMDPTGPGRRHAELVEIDPESGITRGRVRLPSDAACSGVAADDQDRVWCGDCDSGAIRGIRAPTRTKPRKRRE